MFTKKEINKRDLMIKAWEYAKYAAAKMGGKAYQYMSPALRKAWAVLKKANNTTLKLSDIPAWIINKNLTVDGRYGVRYHFDSLEVIRETEKAVLITFHTSLDDYNMWCPKSVIGK